MKIKPIVFVASPYAGEDQTLNIDFARRICRRIALETGAMPFAPHLLYPQFLNDHDTHERDLGISYCSTMLALAHFAAFVLPVWRKEPSSGMKFELVETDELGVPHALAADTLPLTIDDLMLKLSRRFPK